MVELVECKKNENLEQVGKQFKYLKIQKANSGDVVLVAMQLYRFLFVIWKNHFIRTSRHDFGNYPRQT